MKETRFKRRLRKNPPIMREIKTDGISIETLKELNIGQIRRLTKEYKKRKRRHKCQYPNEKKENIKRSLYVDV